MEMMGNEITAIGNDGGQSDSDFRVVDLVGNLARRVSKCKPKKCSSSDRPDKLCNSFSRVQAADRDARKQDLEDHYRRPVIQETLAFNDDGKPFVHSKVFENGEH